MSAIPANIGSIFQGVSGIIGGIGQFIGAKDEAKKGEYNAQIFEQQAQAERESQRLLEFQKRKTIKSQLSSQAAAAGASGFRFSGDPITILRSSVANAELDLAIDKYNSEIRARGFQSSAGMSRYEGQSAAARGYTNAGVSFLSSAAGLLQNTPILSSKGTKLGAGTTSHGIKVPQRYVY